MTDQYRYHTLPRTLPKIAAMLSELSATNNIIRVDDDYNFVVTEKKMENIMDQKHYIIKQLTNNHQRNEDLCNLMHELGYRLVVLNDYSACFERFEESDLAKLEA